MRGLCDGGAKWHRVGGQLFTPYMNALVPIVRFNSVIRYRRCLQCRRRADTIRAVSALDMRADRVTDALLGIRELPRRVLSVGERGERDRAPGFSFQSFTILYCDDRELSLGLIGRFWRPS